MKLPFLLENHVIVVTHTAAYLCKTVYYTGKNGFSQKILCRKTEVSTVKY